MVYITTYCFEKQLWTLLPFFITSCNVFITSLDLEHLCSGPFLRAFSSLFQVNHRTELHLAQDKDYGTTKHLNTIEFKKSFHRPVQKFGLVSALHLSIKTRLEEGRLLTSSSDNLRSELSCHFQSSSIAFQSHSPRIILTRSQITQLW